MKEKLIAIGTAAIAITTFTGCAGNNLAVERAIAQAQYSKTIAHDAKLDESSTAEASAKLDSAKILQEQGEDELAIVLAEQSRLDYRLALAKAELRAAKEEDEKVKKALQADEEKKVIYQGILNFEQGKKIPTGEKLQ